MAHLSTHSRKHPDDCQAGKHEQTTPYAMSVIPGDCVASNDDTAIIYNDSRTIDASLVFS
jgi:hypothetical protein